MRIRSYAVMAAILAAAGSTVAYSNGFWPTLPIVGNPSFCGAIVGASNIQGGTTGQGVGAVGSGGVYCAQTVPAGPTAITGNELIPADTGLGGGAPPQTVTIPSGMIGGTFGTNVLVGADFGQALWQRGTTPLSAATPASAAMGPDGWYALAYASGSPNAVTISKQTGASDTFSGTLASARVQRVANSPAASVAPIQLGQLVPDDTSIRFPGNTAIFSCYFLAGGNFSAASNNVSMVIAYHSAADVTTGAANAQGTNTATFASSAAGTQNITNYTEAVNSTVSITASWARYSVAAAIPNTIPNTTTQVAGIGVKVSWTPSGVAGANDWLEVANCQLESRAGTSVGPSNFNRRTLADEYLLETSRYYAITEAGSGTPVYANGFIPATGVAQFMVQFPNIMRITPISSPITLGGFKFLTSGGSTVAPGAITTMGTTSNTPRTAGMGASNVGGPFVGNAVLLTGNSGSGVLGFSAEP